LKRQTTTSTAVKTRYNAKTYEQMKFQIRKDSQLHEHIILYKKENPQGFSTLIKSLLEDYFANKNLR